LGNPPWERIKLQEQEFFAPEAPEIAAAAKGLWINNGITLDIFCLGIPAR